MRKRTAVYLHNIITYTRIIYIYIYILIIYRKRYYRKARFQLYTARARAALFSADRGCRTIETYISICILYYIIKDTHTHNIYWWCRRYRLFHSFRADTLCPAATASTALLRPPTGPRSHVVVPRPCAQQPSDTYHRTPATNASCTSDDVRCFVKFKRFGRNVKTVLFRFFFLRL